MAQKLIKQLIQQLIILLQELVGSVVFYTQLPIPALFPYQIHRIARFAPWVGVFLGGCLAVGDWLLGQLGLGNFSRSAIVVSGWIALTGGLHLDGVMDTADGLAVQEPKLRLQVMQDSRTGAFGAMAAVLLILLKTAALTDLSTHRFMVLLVAPVWGRWGQVLAIALYPYLKPTGKGAFLKQEMQLPVDFLWGFGCLGLLGGLQIWWLGSWQFPLGIFFGGSTIAWLTGYWFNSQLGGHTGDTYGAVVEWTEAIFLCLVLMGDRS
jgi:adenosylcobinamide-GDP ribazoletransferase